MYAPAMSSPRTADALLGGYALLCTGAIIWPGFSWIPADRPRLLGLPFALAWVVGWCLLTFGVLVAYHRLRPRGEEQV